MKVVLAAELADCVESLTWLNRSVVLKLRSQLDSIQLIFCHWAHDDAWEGSLNEVEEFLDSHPGRSMVIGHLNVDSKLTTQSSGDRSRWEDLCGAMEARGLCHRQLTVPFTRKAKRVNEKDSTLDHIFADTRSSTNAFGQWEGAPGDHCWMGWTCQFRFSRPHFPARRWRCDWQAYQQHCQQNAPDLFGEWTTAEDWLREAVSKFEIRSSRRARRASWEPFSIKTLRSRIRLTQDENERIRLSKQLFNMRRSWAIEREKTEIHASLKKGKRIGTKKQSLFPLTCFQQNSSSPTAAPDQMADIVRKEYEKRWSGDGTVVEPQGLSASVPLDDIHLTEEELQTAICRVKRPWIKDARGIPPAALLGGGTLIQAMLYSFRELLCQDRPWDGFCETGYVKQKELGGVSVKKTRGIVPQSTFLRVLTNVVMARITPSIDTFSTEHQMLHRVLGASRGRQILDIITCAQQALELGRDNQDRAAVGQMDIRTYHDRIDRPQVLASLLRRGVPL